ncbi:MAG: hypothetical protein QOJ16_1838 [Acidobacteriota bacterium]|jgi:hypothetical protein|nr:hypothetical protein [Acidobacteriota bacterium]
MADIDKRLHYFNGQFLQDADFNAEQAYHLERQRRHNRLMHTAGIAEGLAVAVQGGNTVTVSPGTAIDGLGQQIVLPQGDTRTLPLNQPSLLGKTVLVVISYAETTTDPATVGGSGNTRLQERPNVQLVIDDANAPPADLSIRLARLAISGSGTLTGSLDFTPRVAAGSRVGTDIPVQILRLANGLDSTQWPVLTSNAAKEADLAGTLVVSTDVKVGATGQSVAAHLADKSNPHGTTAAQVGALASVAGVSNPGGNVALAPSGAILIGADTAGKKITISENHSGLTNNPHATTAAQVGALALADYDLGQRSISYLSWTAANANGSTVTVPLTFQPRIAWISGQCFATLNGNLQFGGVITGFADLKAAATVGPPFPGAAAATRSAALGPVIPPPQPPTYIQYCFGPAIQRGSTGVLVSASPSPTQSNGNAIAIASFNDSTSSPPLDLTVSVKVGSISGTNLVLTFNTATAAGSTPIKTFTLNLALFCMGVPGDGGGGGAPPGGPSTS